MFVSPSSVFVRSSRVTDSAEGSIVTLMVRRFSAVVTQEEGGVYVAQCLDVDVASHGDSPDEAVAMLREALELYFEDAPSVAKAPSVLHIDVDVPASA